MITFWSKIAAHEERTKEPWETGGRQRGCTPGGGGGPPSPSTQPTNHHTLRNQDNVVVTQSRYASSRGALPLYRASDTHRTIALVGASPQVRASASALLSAFPRVSRSIVFSTMGRAAGARGVAGEVNANAN